MAEKEKNQVKIICLMPKRSYLATTYINYKTDLLDPPRRKWQERKAEMEVQIKCKKFKK